MSDQGTNLLLLKWFKMKFLTYSFPGFYCWGLFTCCCSLLFAYTITVIIFVINLIDLSHGTSSCLAYSSFFPSKWYPSCCLTTRVGLVSAVLKPMSALSWGLQSWVPGSHLQSKHTWSWAPGLLYSWRSRHGTICCFLVIMWLTQLLTCSSWLSAHKLKVVAYFHITSPLRSLCYIYHVN